MAPNLPKTAFSRWLEAKGVTTTQLAALLEHQVVAQSINAWRGGRRSPTKPVRTLLARKLKRYGLTRQLLDKLLDETPAPAR